MTIKRIILFSGVKLTEELTDMVSKNPNKKIDVQISHGSEIIHSRWILPDSNL